jgi:hypothetical protein
MVDRVWIRDGQAAAIQVSLPGYDVKTATLDQMVFDARFANMNLFLKGSLYLTEGSWFTVGFGTTFPTIPRCLVGFQNSGLISSMYMPSAALTNHGSFQYWNAAAVTNSYAQFGAFVNDPDPAVRAANGNGYCFYALYR